MTEVQNRGEEGLSDVSSFR